MMGKRKFPEGLSDGETVKIYGLYCTLKTMFGRQVAIVNDDPRNPRLELDETEMKKDGPLRDLPMPRGAIVMKNAKCSPVQRTYPAEPRVNKVPKTAK